jgi:hypothetical protein
MECGGRGRCAWCRIEAQRGAPIANRKGQDGRRSLDKMQTIERDDRADHPQTTTKPKLGAVKAISSRADTSAYNEALDDDLDDGDFM